LAEPLAARVPRFLRPSGTPRIALTPATVLTVLAILAVLSIVFYMTWNVRGAWSFVIPFRGRKVMAIAMVGTAIAISTVLFQTVTNNRILTPAIMGFDALFSLVRTTQIFLLGGFAYATLDPQLQFAYETVLMVGLSTLLFRWLFSGGSHSLHLLVLVGIVFGVLFRSLSNLMQRLISPNDYAVLQDVLFAGFSTVDQTLLVISSVAIVIMGIWVWRLLPVLDVVALGREQAINLGVDHRRVVSQVLVIVAVLVSVSTALVGPVTFFGLLVANLAYLLIRSHRHALILPAAILLSIICLIGGQAILEHLLGFNSALSIIIEFAGGIVFLIILLRGARR